MFRQLERSQTHALSADLVTGVAHCCPIACILCNSAEPAKDGRSRRRWLSVVAIALFALSRLTRVS